MANFFKAIIPILIFTIIFLVKQALFAIPWVATGFLPAYYLSGLASSQYPLVPLLLISGAITTIPLLTFYRDYTSRKDRPIYIRTKEQAARFQKTDAQVKKDVVIVTLRIFTMLFVVLVAALMWYASSHDIFLETSQILTFAAIANWLILVVMPILLSKSYAAKKANQVLVPPPAVPQQVEPQVGQ